MITSMAVVVGCIATLRAFGNPAKRYLEEIRLDGYTKVDQVNNSSTAGAWADALFIGPPVADVRSIVVAPGLALGHAPESHTGPSGQSEELRDIRAHATWEAYGEATNGCHVAIYQGIDDAYDASRLSQNEIIRAKDGSIAVLRVHVTCGDG